MRKPQLAVLIAAAGCLAGAGFAAHAQQGAPGGRPPIVRSPAAGGMSDPDSPGAESRRLQLNDCSQLSGDSRERCLADNRMRADPRSGSSGGGTQ